MRLNLLSSAAALALLLSPFVHADFQFTSPAAGGSVPAGTISVKWQDDGASPSLSSLTTYQLFLYFGGNNPGTDSLPIWNSPDATSLVSTGGTSFVLDASKGQSVTNGYYFKIIAAATGGSLTAYSTRFSITGMTGTLSATYVNAAQAAGGSTAGPQGQNDISNPATGGAAAGAAEFTVPYQLQTGLTKYAPMQPVPGTQITAKTFTPLHPTSAYTVATTWLPQATIATTLTESQTFSVSSMENTAAPASNPTGDMAKFLARWKD